MTKPEHLESKSLEELLELKEAVNRERDRLKAMLKPVVQRIDELSAARRCSLSQIATDFLRPDGIDSGETFGKL
jgi:hypothetical protein